MATDKPDRAERIEAGRIRHGVGASEFLPGNVCHLVSPVVGFLRMRQRDSRPLTSADLEWFISRLSLVLDLAEVEAEQKD